MRYISGNRKGFRGEALGSAELLLSRSAYALAAKRLRRHEQSDLDDSYADFANAFLPGPKPSRQQIEGRWRPVHDPGTEVDLSGGGAATRAGATTQGPNGISHEVRLASRSLENS